MYLIIIVLLLIIAIEALIAAFEIVFTSLPYVCMFVLSIVMFISSADLRNLIPGHSVMSYISMISILLFITFLLTRIKQISFSFIILCCTFLMCFIFAFVVYNITPDSIPYCIFVSVAFSVLLFVGIFLNLTKYGRQYEQIRNFFFSIVVGILNALTVSCYIVVLGVLWDKYFESIGGGAGTIFGIVHIILLALGSLTAFVLSIITDRRRLDIKY